MAFLGLGALSAFCFAVAAIRRWPSIGVLAVGAFALAAWEFPQIRSLASVGGTQIKTEDAFLLVLMATVLVSPQRFVSLMKRFAVMNVLITVALVISLAAGTVMFGTAAINESRLFFWGIAAVIWMLNQDWSSEELQRNFRRCVYVFGWAMVALFAYHWAVYGMGTADSFVVAADGTEQTGRPLVSGQAMFLVCCGFYLFMGSAEKGKHGRAWTAVIFLVVAALCQHRSVWAAIAIAVVLVLPRVTGRTWSRIVLVSIFATPVVIAVFASGALDWLIDIVKVSVTSQGTYNARLDTWTLLVDDSIKRGAWSVLMGEPFGFGYDRPSSDGLRLLTFGPHNWYVSIYLRLGLLGLAAFAMVLIATVVPLLRWRELIVPAVVFIAVGVYMWSYALPWYLTFWFGWSLAQRLMIAPEEKAPRFKAKPIPPAYKHLAASR